MPNESDPNEPGLTFGEAIQNLRDAFLKTFGANTPVPDARPIAEQIASQPKFVNKRYTPPKSLAPIMPGFGPLITRESIAADIARSGMQTVADELVDLWKKGDTLGAARIKVLEEELASLREENRRYYEENKDLMKVIEDVRHRLQISRQEFVALNNQYNGFKKWRLEHMEEFHSDESRMIKQGVEMSGMKAEGKQPKITRRIRDNPQA